MRCDVISFTFPFSLPLSYLSLIIPPSPLTPAPALLVVVRPVSFPFFLLSLGSSLLSLIIPPVLTGWSYYPLYEMSMLRALYEILVPVDKMMELVSAVIHSCIMASVGKYTMPWIIDRAISALLLTNSWPVLKGARNPEEYLR